MTGGISLRNIVVLLVWNTSQYSLFLHLIRVPLSVPDSGTLIRPRPYRFCENLSVGEGVLDLPPSVKQIVCV